MRSGACKLSRRIQSSKTWEVSSTKVGVLERGCFSIQTLLLFRKKSWNAESMQRATVSDCWGFGGKKRRQAPNCNALCDQAVIDICPDLVGGTHKSRLANLARPSSRPAPSSGLSIIWNRYSQLKRRIAPATRTPFCFQSGFPQFIRPSAMSRCHRTACVQSGRLGVINAQR
jgi:hypothetical protein